MDESLDIDLIKIYTKNWLIYKSGVEILSSAYSYISRVWCGDTQSILTNSSYDTIYNVIIIVIFFYK